MADVKITALTAISSNPVNPATFPIPMVDLLDNAITASGTTKKVTVNQILGAGGTATLASATITGDLTVDTSTLKVDATNDRVGIKTATPRSGFALDVLGNVAIGDSTTTGSYPLVIDSLGTAGTVASIRFKAANVAKAYFGLSGSFLGDTSTDAMVATDSATGAIRFYVADTGVEVARFNSTGNLAFANTKGIDFSAVTGGTGTATANVLNDYEEGTWTPVVADATTGGNVGTCTIGATKYTKIGRQVTVQCYVYAINTTGMTGANTFYIRGLPFVSSSASMGNFYTYRVSRNASTVSSCSAVFQNTSWIFFPTFTTNSATADLSTLVSDIVSGTSEFIVSATYQV